MFWSRFQRSARDFVHFSAAISTNRINVDAVNPIPNNCKAAITSIVDTLEKRTMFGGHFGLGYTHRRSDQSL